MERLRPLGAFLLIAKDNTMYAWLAASILLAPPGDSSRLAVIEPAPEFRLIDSSEKTIRFEQFRGQVVLVGFVFTTCNGSCPATTHRMAKIQHALAERGLLKDKVRLVSITLDPERDRPQALRDYQRLYDIDGAAWHFLTGTPAEVKKVHAAWGMWAKPAANGQLDHPSRVYLVDQRGQIREIYNLDFLRVPWVMDDIESLLEQR
jgi:protein SCO1/2